MVAPTGIDREAWSGAHALLRLRAAVRSACEVLVRGGADPTAVEHSRLDEHVELLNARVALTSDDALEGAESFARLSDISALWKTQAVALIVARQLTDISSGFDLSVSAPAGELRNMQTLVVHALAVHASLLQSCLAFQRQGPRQAHYFEHLFHKRNFFAPPSASLCGLTFHSWTTMTRARRPQALARRRRQYAAATTRSKHELVSKLGVIQHWQTLARQASIAEYCALESSRRVLRVAVQGWSEVCVKKQWRRQRSATLAAAHASNTALSLFAAWHRAACSALPRAHSGGTRRDSPHKASVFSTTTGVPSSLSPRSGRSPRTASQHHEWSAGAVSRAVTQRSPSWGHLSQHPHAPPPPASAPSAPTSPQEPLVRLAATQSGSEAVPLPPACPSSECHPMHPTTHSAAMTRLLPHLHYHVVLLRGRLARWALGSAQLKFLRAAAGQALQSDLERRTLRGCFAAWALRVRVVEAVRAEAGDDGAAARSLAAAYVLILRRLQVCVCARACVRACVYGVSVCMYVGMYECMNE